MKGAFVFRADATRSRWESGGPYFPGSAVYALAYDGRAGRRRLWAGPNSMHFGGILRSSDDFGRSVDRTGRGATSSFPRTSGAALKQIWQIVPGREHEPDTIYCGVEPAALFVSRDAGATWSLDEGLWNHPHRRALAAGRRRPVPAHDRCSIRAARAHPRRRSRPAACT